MLIFIDKFIALKKYLKTISRSNSKANMSTQKKAIEQLLRSCPAPLDGINLEHLTDWVDQLRKKCSQTEIDFKMTSVKNFFCFCCREGLIKTNPFLEFKPTPLTPTDKAK